ncbi:MAG: thiosulfate sulfurtransferase GlpE [Pseudomonadota bacterium]
MTGKIKSFSDQNTHSIATCGIDIDRLKRLQESGNLPQLIDVRRQHAYRASGMTVAGAIRAEPEKLLDEIGQIDRHRVVVAICVHGHEVSQGAAAALRQRGYDAYFLSGGFEALHQRGLLPLTSIEDSERSDVS